MTTKTILRMMGVGLYLSALCVCTGADERKVKSRQKTTAVSNTHDGVAVKAEIVKGGEGGAIGLRIEVLNLDAATDLVLVLGKDASERFHVNLTDAKGWPVSPMPPPAFVVTERGQQHDYRYQYIPPRTSHSLFVALPRNIRKDPRKLTNEDNLIPIPKGAYGVEVTARLGYFRQEVGDSPVPNIPVKPDIQRLKLTIPRISIEVDPDLLKHDVLDAYVLGDAGAEPKKK